MRKKYSHLSFRQVVPNMITSGNILCGMLALILIIHGAAVPAAWMIVMAVFFDYMDGKVARSLGGSSAFGVELDSLADVVSFGVVPAILFYVSYLQGWGGVAGALAATFFAVCGAVRLARFNVQHAVGSFEGLPIPAAGLFLASFIMANVSIHPVVAVILSLGTAFLMVSSVPYGNLKKIKKGNMDRKKAFFLFSTVMAFVVVLQEKAPLAAISVYVVSGLVHFDWGNWLSLVPEENEEPAEQDI